MFQRGCYRYASAGGAKDDIAAFALGPPHRSPASLRAPYFRAVGAPASAVAALDRAYANVWPAEPAVAGSAAGAPAAPFRAAAERLFAACEATASGLLQGLSLGLGLPADAWAPLHSRGDHTLEFKLYAPPRSLAPGAVRVPAHADLSSVTLLLQLRDFGGGGDAAAEGGGRGDGSDHHSGLEVWDRAAGRWVAVRPQPHAVLVNVGEFLQLVTGGRLVSTPHRVAAGADPARETARLSAVFFCAPNWDAEARVWPQFARAPLPTAGGAAPRAAETPAEEEAPLVGDLMPLSPLLAAVR